MGYIGFSSTQQFGCCFEIGLVGMFSNKLITSLSRILFRRGQAIDSVEFDSVDANKFLVVAQEHADDEEEEGLEGNVGEVFRAGSNENKVVVVVKID